MRLLSRRVPRRLKTSSRPVSTRRAYSEPRFESLEPRVLLSATIQLTPTTGTVTTEGSNRVVQVVEGATLHVGANVATSTDALTDFHLDFSNSAAQLGLSNWVTDAAWDQPTDSNIA